MKRKSSNTHSPKLTIPSLDLDLKYLIFGILSISPILLLTFFPDFIYLKLLYQPAIAVLILTLITAILISYNLKLTKMLSVSLGAFLIFFIDELILLTIFLFSLQ